MKAKHQYEDREEEQGEIDREISPMTPEPKIEHNEEEELEAELEEIKDDLGERHNEAREVNLAEDAGIGREDIATAIEGVGKIVPEHYTGHIEKGAGNLIGGKAGEVFKHEHKHYDRENGGNEEPKGTKDGLLILHDKIPLDVHIEQVAVAP